MLEKRIDFDSARPNDGSVLLNGERLIKPEDDETIDVGNAPTVITEHVERSRKPVRYPKRQNYLRCTILKAQAAKLLDNGACARVLGIRQAFSIKENKRGTGARRGRKPKNQGDNATATTTTSSRPIDVEGLLASPKCVI